MNVLFQLALRQYFRQLFRTSFLAVVAVLAVVSALATVMGLRSHEIEVVRYTKLLQQVVQDQARKPGVALGLQLEPSLRVVKPPNPASGVVRGVDPTSPTYWDFSPAGVVPATPLPLHDADQISPTVDIEFIIRVLLGLLAIVLVSDGLSMIQRTGELEGLASFPIPRWQTWVGQYFGGFLVSVTAWIVVAIVIVATSIFSGTDEATRQSVIRTTIKLTLPTTAYLAFMSSLGAALVAFIPKTSTRPLAVLAAWLSISVLAPTSILSAARVWQPAPSTASMISARDEALAVEIRAAELEIGDVLARRPNAGAIVDPFVATEYPELDHVWLSHVQEARRQADSIEQNWQREELAHDLWLHRLELTSPASLFWRAAADSADTGRSNRQAWDSVIRQHSDLLRERLFDDRPRVTVRMPVDRGRQLMVMLRHAPLFLRDLPVFDLDSVSVARKEDAASITLLALYALLLLVVATIRDVRTS